MATGAITESGASMLRWAKETSKPKVHRPQSSEALDKHCLKKKWCVTLTLTLTLTLTRTRTLARTLTPARTLPLRQPKPSP